MVATLWQGGVLSIGRKVHISVLLYMCICLNVRRIWFLFSQIGFSLNVLLATNWLWKMFIKNHVFCIKVTVFSSAIFLWLKTVIWKKTWLQFLHDISTHFTPLAFTSSVDSIFGPFDLFSRWWWWFTDNAVHSYWDGCQRSFQHTKPCQ